MIISRPPVWSAVGGVLPNPVMYTIQSTLPFVEIQILRIDGSLVASHKQRVRGGYAVLDIAAYLRTLVETTKVYSEEGASIQIDTFSSHPYYISYYNEAAELISDADNIRYAVLAAMPELDCDFQEHVIASGNPDWQPDITTLRCLEINTPRTSSIRVVKQIDRNALSPTYLQYNPVGEYDGGYFYYDTNPLLCPLADPEVITAVTVMEILPTGHPEGGGSSTILIATAINLDVATTFTLSNGQTVTIPAGSNNATSAPYNYTETTTVTITAIDNPNITNPNNLFVQVNVATADEVGNVYTIKAEIISGSPHLFKYKVERANASIPATGTTFLGGKVQLYNSNDNSIVENFSFYMNAGVDSFTSSTVSIAINPGQSYMCKVTEASNPNYAFSGNGIQVMYVQAFSF